MRESRKALLRLLVLDHTKAPLPQAAVLIQRLTGKKGRKPKPLELQTDESGQALAEGLPAGNFEIRISFPGRQDQERKIEYKGGHKQQEVFILGKPGGKSFQTGKQEIPYTEHPEWMVLKMDPETAMSPELEKLCEQYGLKSEEATPGITDNFVYLFKLPPKAARDQKQRKAIRKAILDQAGVMAAGSVINLSENGLEYTEDVVLIRFNPEFPAKDAASFGKKHNLSWIQALPNAGNLHRFRAEDLEGYELSALCIELQKAKVVLSAAPEIRSRIQPDYVPGTYLHGLQYESHRINTQEAWNTLRAHAAAAGLTEDDPRDYSAGSAQIAIAIHDDGIGSVLVENQLQARHPAFHHTLKDGHSKIRNWFNANNGANDNNFIADDHGTQAGGTASAKQVEGKGVSGIGPDCRVIAFISNGDHEVLADSYLWMSGLRPTAPVFGSPPELPIQPADVINNSFSYSPGVLNAVQEALIMGSIAQAASNGRGGRGTVILFSSGNANTDHTTKTIFGNSDRIILVGASGVDPTGEEEIRAVYSNYGMALDVIAPSGNSEDPRHYNHFSFYHPEVATILSTQTFNAGYQFLALLDADRVQNDSDLLLNRTINRGAQSNRYLLVGAPGEDQAEIVRIAGGSNRTINISPLHFPHATGTSTGFYSSGNATSRFAPGAPSLYHPGNSLPAGAANHQTYLTANIQRRSFNIAVADNSAFVLRQYLAIGNPGDPNFEIRRIGNFNGAGSMHMEMIMHEHDAGEQVIGLTLNSTIPIGPLPGTLDFPVDNASGFLAGQRLLIGNPDGPADSLEVVTIDTIAGNNITLLPPGINLDHSANADLPVHVYGGEIASTLVGDFNNSFDGVSNFDPVTLEVVSSAGFYAGQAILIGDPANLEQAENQVVLYVPDGTHIRIEKLVRDHTDGTAIVGGMPNYSGNWSGTSAACPVVAGTAALLLSGKPSLTWIEVRQILRDTAEKIQPAEANATGRWVDNDGDGIREFSQWYGYGRIDAARAVSAALAYDHDARDLMIRDHLQDDGINPTHAAAISSPDIWVRNLATANDPNATPATFEMPGRHHDPYFDADRVIYARIKNRGNSLDSLPAWVRFYLVYTDQPGPFSFSAHIANYEDISALTGTRNTGTYFLGEVEIEDPIPPGGDTTVNLPWPEAQIPEKIQSPPGIHHNLYLFVHVSPSDGHLAGDGIHEHSNISYRKLQFASDSAPQFDFMEPAGTPLPQTLQTASAGGSISSGFRVVVYDVETFNPEHAAVSITRNHRDGTVETHTFEFSGGAWTAGPPAWLTLNAPVTLAVVNPGNNPIEIAFDGSIEVDKTIANVEITARIGDGTNTIREESFTQTLFTVTGLPGSGSPLMGNKRPYAFAALHNLQAQTQAQAFGPKSDQLFRLTSSFTADTDVMAYAALTGTVFIQLAYNDTINLIIKPLQQSGAAYTPVKYLVYRGLRKADFLHPEDETRIRERDGASEFIGRVHNVHEALRSVTADTEAEIPAQALGWDPTSQQPTDALDQYFFSTHPNLQFPVARKGMALGHFHHADGNAFGFEIVLEEGSFQPDLGYARKTAFSLDFNINPTGNANEEKARREEILDFMDPAAWYGLHYQGGTDHHDGTGSQTVREQDLVTHILAPFYTKNWLYLDIRNENGYSFDYYGNYQGTPGSPDQGSQLRIGTAPESVSPLPARQYETSKWPLLILKTAVSTPEDHNLLYLSLRKADNLKPLVYLKFGHLLTQASSGQFIQGNTLLANPGDTWTKEIGLAHPNTPDPTQPGNRNWVSGMIKLHYSREIDTTTTWPANVVPTRHYTDNAFGPIDSSPLLQSGVPIEWVSNQDLKFIDGAGYDTTNPGTSFSFMAERGVAFEPLRTIWYAIAADPLERGGLNFPPNTGITSGTSTKGSFFEVAYLFRDLNPDRVSLEFTDKTIELVRLIPVGTTGPAIQSVMFIGLTNGERDRLRDLTGLNKLLHQRTLLLQEIIPEQVEGELEEEVIAFTDDNFKQYRKFLVGLQGLDDNGNASSVFPAQGNEIIVYTVDSLAFCTEAFGSAQPVTASFSPNYEERFYLDEPEPASYISNSPTIQAVVDDTLLELTGIADDANTLSNLQQLCRIRGEELYETAVSAAKASLPGSDRPLYWARLKMIIALKQHPYLLSHASELADTLAILETYSRGRHRVNFKASNPAWNGIDLDNARKILISGFDPFQLDYGIGISNPSGIVALALNDESYTENGVTAIVQSAIYPVRYRDFDNDDVEDFFGRYLQGPDQVDMIVTISQNGGLVTFDLERFAGRLRGGFKDNEGLSTSETALGSGASYAEFYETTLPVSNILPAPPVDPGADGVTVFDQSYASSDSAEQMPKDGGPNTNTPSFPLSGITGDAETGSGGDYLSNEIFYRVARIRENMSSPVKTGHFHVPAASNTITITQIRDRVIDLIKDSLSVL